MGSSTLFYLLLVTFLLKGHKLLGKRSVGEGRWPRAQEVLPGKHPQSYGVSYSAVQEPMSRTDRGQLAIRAAT